MKPIEDGTVMVFTCPSCGDPSAVTTEQEIDIHSGATYHCAMCGHEVIFTAETPAQYVQRHAVKP